MTLYQFLKATQVDVKNIYCQLGNMVYHEISIYNPNFDYDKNIDEITDNELYQVGRILCLHHAPFSTLFGSEILDKMKSLIEEVKLRLDKNEL